MVSERYWLHGIKLLREQFLINPPVEQLRSWKAILDDAKITDETYGHAIKHLLKVMKTWYPSTNLAAAIIEYRSEHERYGSANHGNSYSMGIRESLDDVMKGFSRMLLDRAIGRRSANPQITEESNKVYADRMMREAICEMRDEGVTIPPAYKRWLDEHGESNKTNL